MKILIATGLYPPEVGGPATYSKILETELPKKGIETKILPFSTVRGLPPFIRHFVYFLKVIKVGRGVDLIYAQDPVSVGLPAFFAASILRKRFVLKVVGDYAWEQGKTRFGVKETLDDFVLSKNYPFFVRLLKKTESFVARNASVVVVPSNYLKKIVSHWDVPSSKIKVVYNAFDGKFEEVTQRISGDEKIIITAGRLVPWKGIFTLIAIVPDLIKHFPKFKLIIAGDGPERPRLEHISKELGLSKQVLFTGSLEQEKLYKYIKSADVFVLNTAYEGFSHQLLEVMAIGTPIVTTNIGGNPEVVENEVNGLLVSPDDHVALVRSIERIILDEEFAKKLSGNSRNTAKLFTIERMIGETIKALNIKK